MTERVVKSFEDMFSEHYGLEDFSGDAYVEYLAKSGELGLALQKAPGGVYYTGGPNWTRPTDTYAGYPNIGTQYADLTPLRIQNLDATMTTVLFKRRNFVLWDWLSKVPTMSTLYEYDKIRSYGSGRSAPGFSEGGIPALSMPRYERDQATVRYLGVQRGVTQQSRMVGRAGGLMMDPVRAEIENGTLNLLEKITRTLYFGDSNVLDEQGATVNYDGITTQVAAQNDALTVLDLQGNPAKFGFSLFDNIATTLVEKGFVTEFSNIKVFMNPRVLTDLSKVFYTAGASATNTNANFETIQRIIAANKTGSQYVPGAPIPGYDTNFGHFNFTSDVMFQEVEGNAPVCATDAVRSGHDSYPQPDPGAPGASWTSGLGNLTLTEIHSQVTTASTTGVPAGTYYYWVAAVGIAGESAPVALGSVNFTHTSAHDSQVQIAQNAGGNAVLGGYGSTGQPVQYRVYRSQLSSPWVSGQWADQNGGLIGHFVQPNATPSGTAVVFTDSNGTVPGTGNILILEGSTENLQVPQLTPLLKYNLPPVGTLEPFLLMLYHTIIYKATRRAFWIKNVPVLV